MSVKTKYDGQMVKWANYGLLQANASKMLVNNDDF